MYRESLYCYLRIHLVISVVALLIPLGLVYLSPVKPIVEINCTGGFVVKGSLTRCVKGVLTSQYCAPAPCPNIQPPINGTLGNCPSSLSSGMTCDFVCNAGAQLEGPGAGSPPACVATPCSYTINGRTWWAYAIGDGVHTARWMTLSQAHSNLADVMTEAVGAGGHLVTIDSAAVQTFVDLHWSGYSTWIGLQRVSGCDPTQSGVAAGVQSTQCWNVAPSPNYWNWGTLNPLTLGFDTSSYSHWSSGEPNNFGDVESAAINLANKGGWNDVDPTKPYYGIIEIHSSPDVTDGTFCWAGSLGAQTCGTHPCDYSAPFNGLNGTCNDKLSSGSTCIPTCAQGYTLTATNSGSLVAQCIDGEIVQPSFLPSSCIFNYPAFMYSSTCATVIDPGTSCQIQCLPGYNVTGSSTSCSYGTLTSQTCTESPCTVTKDPFGYLGSCSVDPFGTSVSLASQADCQINCTGGFVVKGSLTRCVKGVLTSQYCAPAPCPNIQPPINGTLGNCPSSLSSGMTCDFVCNAGAQLEGPGAGSPPACVATPCSYTINGRTWWAYAIGDGVHTARWMTLSQAHSNLADVMTEAVGAGGHLVTIDSAAVQTFVDLH